MQTEAQLEVCLESLDDALGAVAAGAHRLELNCALALGGLTPSRALIESVVSAVDVPVIVMIRPRGAGFRYNTNEKRVMLHDAESALAAGAAGIACGALTDDGHIDTPFWSQMKRAVGDRQLVFHRAFDVLGATLAALDVLVSCGTTRVLTSGGRRTAMDGAVRIAELQQVAEGRIQILPGAGLNADNIPKLIAQTRCRQAHGSFQTTRRDPADPVAVATIPQSDPLAVSAAVLALQTAVQRLGPS